MLHPEDIGADVLGELGVQRETIIRTADKVRLLLLMF